MPRCGRTGGTRVVAGRVDRGDDLLHGGVAAPTITIVEDEDMAGTGVVGGNPDATMLLPENLVGLRAEFVLDGITPTIEQVAAFSVGSAAMAGGLGGGGAVINDPDFVVAPATDQDLVKLRVVINSVEMIPELLVLSGGWIGIDQSNIIADDTVIVLGRIVILDQVIPCVPFPDNLASVGPGGLDFGNVVGEHVSAGGGDRGHAQVGIESGGDDIGKRFHFADDHN